MARYIIEIAEGRNGNHLFGPTSERLRGRWDFGNTADKRIHSEALAQMAREIRKIPGQHVLVDTEKMEGLILDPLGGDSEHAKAMWAKIDRIINEHKVEFGGSMQPHPTKKVSLDHDGVKEWLWEMRSIVNAEQGEVATGSDPLPTLDDIRKLPGRRRRDPLNTGPQLGTGKQGDEHLVKYVDVVPVSKGQQQPAGA